MGIRLLTVRLLAVRLLRRILRAALRLPRIPRLLIVHDDPSPRGADGHADHFREWLGEEKWLGFKSASSGAFEPLNSTNGWPE